MIEFVGEDDVTLIIFNPWGILFYVCCIHLVCLDLNPGVKRLLRTSSTLQTDTGVRSAKFAGISVKLGGIYFIVKSLYGH
jgi:hypothetical protein